MLEGIDMNESLDEAGGINGGLVKSGGGLGEWKMMGSELVERNEWGLSGSECNCAGIGMLHSADQANGETLSAGE